MTWMQKIVEQYGKEYVLRQLAEESAELCQAALKLVRVMNNETPVTQTDAQNRLLEEIADVEVMLHVLKTAVLNDRGNEKITTIYRKKEARMIERMIENDETEMERHDEPFA